VDGVYEETYTYDINGNVISSYDGFGTTTYTYNPSYNFELILVKDGENRVKYRLSRDPYKTGLVEVVEDYTPYAYSIDEMGNIASVGYYYHGTSPSYSLTDTRHLTIPGSTNFAAEHMTYDNYGNILTRTDAKGNTTSYEYNCQGLLTKTTYPCAQGQTAPTETRSYFADKTLCYSVDRNSNLTEYQYDALGRCTSEVVSSVDILLSTKSKTYDANGNLLNDGHIQRTYDAFNRVLTHTQNGFETVTYTYDVPYTSQWFDVPDGYETVMQSTEFSVHNMYDSNGLLRAVSNKDGASVQYQYNHGHCTSYSGLTGYTTYYQYNQAGQITQIRDYTTTSWYEVLEYLLCYTYDERANMTSEIAKEDGVTVNTKTYAYDSANRLICETDSSQSVKIEYMYDKNGNLENKYTKDLQNDDVYRSLQLYAYDVNNRVTSSFSDRISYDANGNSLQANNHNLNVNYTYDGFNRIKTAAPVGQNQTFDYTYASDNLRLQTVCRDALGNEVYRYDFLYDTSGNLLVRKKTNADGSVYSNCILWGISPHSGYSPVGMTVPESGNNEICAGFSLNAHGDVVRVWVMTSVSSSYAYDAYGDILEENIELDWLSNPFRYAGYYYDTETGLYYLKNRYYNGYSTRFLTEDPYWNVSNMLYGKFTNTVERRVYYPAVVQSGNRYAYCGNMPIKYTDTSGYSILLTGTEEEREISFSQLQKLTDDTLTYDRSTGWVTIETFSTNVLRPDGTKLVSDLILNDEFELTISRVNLENDGCYTDYGTNGALIKMNDWTEKADSGWYYMVWEGDNKLKFDESTKTFSSEGHVKAEPHGEVAYIILGHELLHATHHMNNDFPSDSLPVRYFNKATLSFEDDYKERFNSAEEYRTTGISYRLPNSSNPYKTYHPEGITENSLRAENGLRIRIIYE